MTISLVLACALAALVVVAGAVSISWRLTSTVKEDLPAASVPFGDTSTTKITHTGLNVSRELSAASPAGFNVTVTAQGQIAMTAGAATLNLAAAPGTAGPTAVDATGLKLRTLLIRSKSDNANPITIAKGASNGFTGLGANFFVRLDPGKAAAFEGDATAVASGVRTFDISGTGAQVLEFIATFGSN